MARPLLFLAWCGFAAALVGVKKRKDAPATSIDAKPASSSERSETKKFVASRSAADGFLPTCVAHLKKVIKKVDGDYTDQQLEQALQTECDLSSENPIIFDVRSFF